MLMFTLNEAINFYGQDLKNKQWILEPVANMVIALAVLDSGFKRFKNVTPESELKGLRTPVLELVVHKRFNEIFSNGMDILSHLDGKDNGSRCKIAYSKKHQMNKGYSPLTLMKRIADDIDRNKKYYLD